MTTQTEPVPAVNPLGLRGLFSRIVVGIDDSPESHEAARQAAILAETDGHLTLVAAWNLAPLLLGAPGSYVPVSLDEDAQRTAAEDALRRAGCEVHGSVSTSAQVVRGTAWDVLMREATEADASLIAVGSHGRGRMQGILMGSTTTEVVHKAPCSVLVARGSPVDFPRRIVVGVDGSVESVQAFAAARHLAERFGAELWPVVGEGGKGVDRQAVISLVGHRFESSPDAPVDAIVAAASEADLVLVGSRGLHGLASLGSVSEQVAHRARCSTLVVREAAADRADRREAM